MDGAENIKGREVYIICNRREKKRKKKTFFFYLFSLFILAQIKTLSLFSYPLFWNL
jgi:hypothetical protein